MEEKISFDCLLSLLVAFSEDFDGDRFPSFAYTVAGSKMTYSLAPCLTEVVVHALSKLQAEHGIQILIWCFGIVGAEIWYIIVFLSL